MKTTYFLLFMLCFQFLAVGQDWDFEKPNYKTIEKNIKDEASNLFYPNLMKRFKAADSTMTLEEKRHLYYGYSFQKDYSPYSHSDYEDSLRAVLQKDKLESVDFENIQKFGDSILSDNPFNIRG
ncbi:MAG: DUF4919 domain-containing protein [Algicola sp.]|nr:DUF4919 domain-containing protein [Algicola sp.]